MEENELGAALWNGECWITEKDPPDWEKHLEAYASHDVATIEDLMKRKEAADRFVKEAKE